VPFACQILRGITGNSGNSRGCDQESSTIPPQVSGATAVKRPKLPKLMAPYVELSSPREQLPHSRPRPAQALSDSLHGALRWGVTAGTSVRKPGRMEGYCHLHGGGGRRSRSPRVFTPPRVPRMPAPPEPQQQGRRRGWFWRLRWLVMGWFEALRNAIGRRS
jgi:hypothetical protein